MKRYIKSILPAGALLLALGMTSCTKDLDVDPISPKISTDYSAEGLFNKCYANFAMAGLGDGGIYPRPISFIVGLSLNF